MKKFMLMAVLLMGSGQAFAAPEVQQHTMENGLNILLIQAHHVPMVAMKLVMPAGSRFDAQGKGGSASLLSDMLMDHTKTYDYQAWAAKLDDASIRLGAGVDKDAMSMSLTVLKEAVAEGVDAMSQALLQPGWDKKRFDFLHENTVSSMVKAQEEATTFATLAEAELLFPNQPYGHPVSGTLASLKTISLADLKAVYTQQVKPEGSTLAVSGDITMDEVIKLAQTYFGQWQGQPQHLFADIQQPQPSKKSDYHHVMDKHQTLVEWVRLGPSRHDEHYASLLVLNHMLGGGGFGSQLMEEIREKRGLVYGVYSWFQPLETSGAYVIRLQTRSDQADEAEAVLKEVLKALSEGAITQEMLDKSKTNLMGGFAQRMDSNRERVGLLGMMGLYHRPLDYLQNWTESVKSVTLADVRRDAKKYLPPDSWKQIWVGPKKANQTKLKDGA